MMAEASLEPQNVHPTRAALVRATAYWLDIDEDVALGCECADPALQIERWDQEIQAGARHAS